MLEKVSKIWQKTLGNALEGAKDGIGNMMTDAKDNVRNAVGDAENRHI